MLILVASLGFLGLTYIAPSLNPAMALQHKTEGTLASLSVDEPGYNALKQGKSPGKLEPLSIAFNGYDLFLDTASKTYFYSMTGRSNSAANPSVEVLNGGERFGIAFLRSPITPETVGGNYGHRFLLYTNAEYTEYRFTATTLPLVSIDTRHPDVMADTFISDKKSAASMTLFDNNPEISHVQRVIRSDIDIRIRGATTRGNPKKSFRVFLTMLSLGRHKRVNPVSLLGMRVDEDWILYAPYLEPDKMRNIMATNIWQAMSARNNRFGVNNGTEAKYVELLINGRYQGIYGLMPPVDYKQLDIRVAEDPRQSEYFYRKISNTPAREHSFYKRTHRNHHLGFRLRFPKHTRNTYAKWAPLGDYVALLSGTQQEYETGFPRAVEMENAVDMWLFVNATMGVDNIEKNVSYVAKRGDDGYVMLFSPWDMDQTWGSPWSGTGTLLTTVPGSFSEGLWIHEEMPIGRALLCNSFGIWGTVAERWARLRRATLSDENMNALITEHAGRVFGSGAIARDYARWRYGAPVTDEAAIRATVLRRLAAMDREIERISHAPEKNLHPEPLPMYAGP